MVHSQVSKVPSVSFCTLGKVLHRGVLLCKNAGIVSVLLPRFGRREFRGRKKTLDLLNAECLPYLGEFVGDESLMKDYFVVGY